MRALDLARRVSGGELGASGHRRPFVMEFRSTNHSDTMLNFQVEAFESALVSFFGDTMRVEAGETCVQYATSASAVKEALSDAIDVMLFVRGRPGNSKLKYVLVGTVPSVSFADGLVLRSDAFKALLNDHIRAVQRADVRLGGYADSHQTILDESRTIDAVATSIPFATNEDVVIDPGKLYAYLRGAGRASLPTDGAYDVVRADTRDATRDEVVAAARRIDEICAAGCSLQAALEKIAEEEDDEISFSACSALVQVLRHARTADLLNSLKPRIARNVKAQASAIASYGGGGSCLDPTEEELDELCGGL